LTATETAEAAPRRAKAARHERILVVDDVEDNRNLLIRRLEREGFRDIVQAGDGEEALARIAGASFDLVLLDVMMPRCDGYQVLERLKGLGRLHELPVIVISALNEIDSVVRCIQLGAVDYLPKPFNPTLLRARVSASLDQKRLRDEVRAHLTRLEEELNAARTLQMSMVPVDFPVPSAERPVEVFAFMEPAREVGGDLYDFFFTADGRLAFAIGDASGKGVPAAMFMARTKNLLRLVSSFMEVGGTLSPGDVLTRVNQELCEGNPTMMFVTLFFGVFDPKSGEVLFSNAGHDPPCRLDGKGVTLAGGAQGMALGIAPGGRYQTGSVRLAPGETLYLYTDGITEASDPADQLFGKDRLAAALQELSAAPLSGLVRGIVDSVRHFAQGAPQSDDITALAVRGVAGR